MLCADIVSLSNSFSMEKSVKNTILSTLCSMCSYAFEKMTIILVGSMKEKKFPALDTLGKLGFSSPRRRLDYVAEIKKSHSKTNSKRVNMKG